MKKEGLRYHHIGIPNSVIRDHEYHLPQFGMYVVGHEHSEYGVEWLRFDDDSPLPEIVRTVPHVAFVVDDLDDALKDREVLIAPNNPSSGVRVAFVVENGAPIELMEFDCEDHPDR